MQAAFAAVLAQHEDRQQALHAAYQHLDNAGLISKVALARYLCPRGCVLATVVGVGGLILVRTRDYKFSPGLNADQSVARARERNTLDGNRHWPGHTFDIAELASWGPRAGMAANCRHRRATLNAEDVLAQVDGVSPGHPRAPIFI